MLLVSLLCRNEHSDDEPCKRCSYTHAVRRARTPQYDSSFYPRTNTYDEAQSYAVRITQPAQYDELCYPRTNTYDEVQLY
jgi:hypothetical protein